MAVATLTAAKPSCLALHQRKHSVRMLLLLLPAHSHSATQVTAYASGNPDFPGACGRCYEVKCSPGPALGWAASPSTSGWLTSLFGGMQM
jgi:hypothetical protein